MANVEALDRKGKSDKADRLMTVISGWAAVILGILGLHRWVAVGVMDGWARAGLIFAFVLAIMWVWGFWPEITARLRGWVRGGGLNTAMIAIGLILTLILVNTLVRRRVVLKADLTQNKRFTLAPRTREILKSLAKPIKATVFIPAGRSTARARDLFKQYGDASDKFQWTHVDPLVDQKALLALQPPPKLNSSDLSGAVLEYNGQRQDVTEFTEKTVTSAILKMTRDTKRKLLFLRGHGEPDVTAAASGDPARGIGMVLEDLRSMEWPVEGVDLYAKDAKVPDPSEAAVLIIAGPQRELAPVEEQRINEYLGKGGRVLLLLENQGPSYSTFLGKWGVKTGNDVVFGENEGGLLLVDAAPTAHEAVRAGRRVVFRPLHSVSAATPAPAGITVTELLSSGPQSRIVSNYVPGKPVDVGAATPGPAGIGVMAEKKIGTGDSAKTARLIVLGGSDWMTDQWTRLPFFNAALGSSLINYLGEEDALVAIPPKDENTEQAFLTDDQRRLLTLVHFWDFPLLALLLAIVVYLKRR
jgi:hypothetical protein